jgi:hypothetical protein
VRTECSSTAAIRAAGPAASGAPIDSILARLLAAPAQILANPLNVIGPGGWLIGNGVDGRTSGQHGGLGGLLAANDG